MKEVLNPDPIGTLKYSERPAFASVYAIAGRFISIQSADPEVAEMFRRYFSGWHLAPVANAEFVTPDATIVAYAAAEPPPPPAHLESFEVADGGVCRTDPVTYFFESNGSVVRAGADEPVKVEVWFGEQPQARERAARARLIFNAAMTATRRCGLFELHAAGAVAPDGTGVLVIGPSGSGKSTLATQFAAAGWNYLSDDSLLLSLDQKVVRACALRRVFALKHDTFALDGFAKLAAHATDALPFDPLKKRFEPHSVFPDRFVPECVPTRLFFSQLTHEPASCTRALSRRETMARLIRMCPWSCYDEPAAQSHLGVLATLARQSTGYELQAGNDLFGDAEYASRYLLSQTQ